MGVGMVWYGVVGGFGAIEEVKGEFFLCFHYVRAVFLTIGAFFFKQE